MAQKEIDELKNRVNACIEIIGIQKQRFAQNVHVGRSTMYMWLHGTYELNEEALKRIEEYLIKLGF